MSKTLDFRKSLNSDRIQIPETVADEISEIVKILLVGENEKDFLRMQKFTADRYQNLDMFLNDLSMVIKSSEVSCKVKYNLLSGKNTGILTGYKKFKYLSLSVCCW